MGIYNLNYFSITLFLGCVIGIISAFMTIYRHSNLVVNKRWFYLNLLTALWSLGYFLMISTHNFLVAQWSNHILHALAGFIPSLFLQFVLAITNQSSKYRKSVIISYIFACIFLILNPTNLILLDVKSKYIFQFVSDAGPLFILYTIHFFFWVIYSEVVLIFGLKKASGLMKQQLRYVLFTTLFGFGGGSSVFFLTFSDKFPPYTLILFALYPLPIDYAIIKYRLMNIRFILTKGILYFLLTVFVSSFFALVIFISGLYLGEGNKNNNIIVYIITSLIVVVFLDPLKNVFAKLTDNIFYKDRIDYQVVAQKASAIVAREIYLEKLSKALTNLLVNDLKIKEVFVFIAKDEVFNFLYTSQKNINNLSLSPDFIHYIQNHKDFIVIEELIKTQGDISLASPQYKEVDKFIKEAEDLKIEMVVPIVDDNKLLSAIFLFSAKNSGDLYNQDDINFLNVLAPQIATSIEKSKLYEEVQVLNRELQAKVDARTKSLKEANLGLEQRNKFLIAMQGVTNMVSRTMDLKQVNQLIANSIATEFGYVGGILSFIDEKNNVLRIGAITENEHSDEVVQILGQDPKNFEAKMQMTDLLGVKTVLSGQMNTSDKMSDFFSPPVEKNNIDRIQEILGVKTIVGLPIFSEDKIIGIVHFLLAVEESKFTSLDRDTMIALADQVGIVSRNLRLYNNLQATNQDLQVANMRLRELDQAKSEFLSIASHQLRTPISALKGYLSMISDGDFGTVPPKISKVVKDLFESAARLARLVNIFLNVSRIESGRLKIEKKPLQISDMIESVIAELHNESDKKGVKLIYKKPKPALPLVAADADKLREVVLNLIDNSIKYTPKGQIEVSALVENENLHFKVQDTGIGIDPEEAKNLFRKFVRASGAAQVHTGGSGLGLFIAQKIIKEHGGQIWVESAGKEQGSAFQFVIPMTSEVVSS